MSDHEVSVQGVPGRWEWICACGARGGTKTGYGSRQNAFRNHRRHRADAERRCDVSEGHDEEGEPV